MKKNNNVIYKKFDRLGKAFKQYSSVTSLIVFDAQLHEEIDRFFSWYRALPNHIQKDILEVDPIIKRFFTFFYEIDSDSLFKNLHNLLLKIIFDTKIKEGFAVLSEAVPFEDENENHTELNLKDKAALKIQNTFFKFKLTENAKTLRDGYREINHFIKDYQQRINRLNQNQTVSDEQSMQVESLKEENDKFKFAVFEKIKIKKFHSGSLFLLFSDDKSLRNHAKNMESLMSETVNSEMHRNYFRKSKY